MTNIVGQRRSNRLAKLQQKENDINQDGDKSFQNDEIRSIISNFIWTGIIALNCIEMNFEENWNENANQKQIESKSKGDWKQIESKSKANRKQIESKSNANCVRFCLFVLLLLQHNIDTHKKQIREH